MNILHFSFVVVFLTVVFVHGLNAVPPNEEASALPDSSAKRLSGPSESNDPEAQSPAPTPGSAAETSVGQIFEPGDEKIDRTISQIGAEVRRSGNQTELPPMIPPVPKIGAPNPLTLLKAVQLTVEKNFSIAQSKATVLSSQGQLRQAAGPFDPTVSLTANGLYQPTSQSSSVTQSAAVPNYYYNSSSSSSLFNSNQNTIQSQGSLSKTFRSGITVEAFGQTYQTALSGEGNSAGDQSSQGYNYSYGTVGLIVQVPLLKGLGYDSYNTANERASGENLRSAEYNLGFTISQQICNTITFYWSCLQAQKAVQIALANERGSKQLADITEALIKGYLQPVSSLVQARANYNTYVSQRIQAEQQQSSATQQLAQNLGFGPEDLFNEPLVVSPFSLSDHPYDLQPADIKALVEIAMKCRLDIRAAKITAKASETLLKGLKNNALPQLNLTFGVGMQNQRTTDNTGATLSNTSQNESQNSSQYGQQIGVAISGEWPFGNDAAQGAVIQQTGQRDSARIQVALLESQATSLVITAAKSVINYKKALKASEAAARQQLESVRAQEKLFSLGMSSIVDVITTQTDFTSAQLTLITNQANYAIAIGQLRYATGTLVSNTILTNKEKKLLPPIPGLPDSILQASYSDQASSSKP